jgi:hypothetical protein
MRGLDEGKRLSRMIRHSDQYNIDDPLRGATPTNRADANLNTGSLQSHEPDAYATDGFDR